MRTTKLLFFVITGLAMIEFSIGQLSSSVAATTTHKTSHASPEVASSEAKPSAMSGVATIYANALDGRKTASGQRFCQKRLTAAHRTLPLGTKVRVINVRSKQSVDVVINDRGPWHTGRIIDLSAAAAAQVGMRRTGKILVKLEVLPHSATHKS